MARVEQDEWAALWDGIRELSEFFPVFIGGVAVYLQALAHKMDKRLIEFSHDGDFYISLADFSDLRDLEEITQNRRLHKHQLIKHGIEFDVYVENNNRLRVKYVDVMDGSQLVDSVRVASLEHLLVLKLDAYEARRGSAKGRKDERDLIRLMHMLAGQRVNRKRLAKYLTPPAFELLSTIERSSEFLGMCRDNLKKASDLRVEFIRVLGAVGDALEQRP